MFNNLIESSSHAKEFKRRGSFLLFTTGTYLVLFVVTGVISIYAYDARLEQTLEITLISPQDFAPEPDRAPARQRPLLLERDRGQMLERGACILLRIERQRGLVLREAMAVGELGILLLQVPGVSQQDCAKIDGRARAINRSAEAALDQQRQIAGVIEMGMGENNGVDGARLRGKRRPILQAQRLEALKQAAVDEQPVPFVLHEEFRSGNGTDAAEKREVQAHAATLRDVDSAISLIGRLLAGLIHVNIGAGDADY